MVTRFTAQATCDATVRLVTTPIPPVTTEIQAPLRAFTRQTLVKGRPTDLRCVEVNGQTYSITTGPVTVAKLEDEWYEDVRDPAAVIEILTEDTEVKADIFTFREKVPNIEPKYQYHTEWESIAVLPVQSFDYWWNKQVKGTTRNMIRKSQKAGVEVRECTYDDAFVRGMTDIFNETSVRQGRQFWHYGKDFDTVKQQFSRYLFREYLIGAYCGDEFVGFAMVGNAGTFADLGQIISKVRHRDKAINNALLSKAVEICATKKLPYLVYGFWTVTSLANFKRHSGFQEMRLPRYFVPLTHKGKLGLKLGLQRGWRAALPDSIVNSLKNVRKSWHQLRAR